MNVYLLDAREHASWDEHEAWIVIAHTPEEAWETVLAGRYEIPVVRTYRKQYHVEVEPRRPITLSEMKVEILGTSTETTPRVAFDAFLRG